MYEKFGVKENLGPKEKYRKAEYVQRRVGFGNVQVVLGKSSIKGRLSSMVVFNQSSSSVKGCLLSKVVFHHRSSSIKGSLPSKVVFHQRLSSIKGRLPSKVVFFHQRSSHLTVYKVKGLIQ